MSKRKFAKIVSLAVALVAAALALCSCSSSYTPAGMKLISEEGFDFKLYVPTTWTSSSAGEYTSAYYSNSDRSNVSMMPMSYDMSKGLDEFWDEYKSEFEGVFSDMKYEVEGDNILVDRKEAKKYVYTATVSGTEYKFMQVAIKGKSMFYIFTYTSTPENYDLHSSAAEDILSNILFDE